MELHDSRPTLTANSAGAVVMFAVDSINAAHESGFRLDPQFQREGRFSK